MRVRRGFWRTNTVESYFSIVTRGINGVYHHVSSGTQIVISPSTISDTTNVGPSVSTTPSAWRRPSPGIEGKRLINRRSGFGANV